MRKTKNMKKLAPRLDGSAQLLVLTLSDEIDERELVDKMDLILELLDKEGK